MPYIDASQKFREDMEDVTDAIEQVRITNAGELNYLITLLCHRYVEQQLIQNHRQSYSNYNEVIGALECSKLEFYRRLVSPYEDSKIKENGDVVPRGL